MDRLYFAKSLKNGVCLNETEKTQYLEVLNYSSPLHSTSEWHNLSKEDFRNYFARKGVFAPRTVPETVTFINGLRLVLQSKAQDPKTFEPNVIPFEKDDYESLVNEMHLPLRALEAASAVGPFFWWSIDENPENPVFQLIFRKSDIDLGGKSKGWEMMLSYSFKTNITSGFVKATENKNWKFDKEILPDLKELSTPVTHPLLLPFLMLNIGLSSENDINQRNSRERIRRLEHALSARYQDRMGISPSQEEERNLELDTISRDLTQCHCEVLWKRPQAWQNVVKRLRAAAEAFWKTLPKEQRNMPSFKELHDCIVSRFEFISIKLEGLENYAHVSLERLTLQREVMHSILNQRESRLNLEIAVQQRRDGMSMKTLTLVGALFLPGTFLSSMFSMPFFDFSDDMNGPVSQRLWIYFVLLVPVTVLVLAAWLVFDKRSKNISLGDVEEAETRLHQLETQITARIRRKTGARLMTMDTNTMLQQRSNQ